MAQMQKWNWQDANWPNWQFYATALQDFEARFLLSAGELAGAWKHLHVADQEHLKISLISEEAIKTSQIEGEFLDRASVQSSVRRQFGLTADRRAGPSEAGIAEMMVDCFEQYNAPLTHDQLHNWHKMICNGRTDIQSIGTYRTHAEAMQVVSGPLQKPKVHFEAPPSDRMPDEMQTFLDWFADCNLPPLTKSGLAHLYFVSIHPYEDGNGRIARALCEKTLAQALGHPSLIALSHQIEGRRKAYYDQLEVSNKSLEITQWLTWFAQIVLDAQAYSIAMITHLIAKTKMMDRLRGQINPRQEKALIRMFDAGPDGFEGGLSAKNYMTITDTVPATARRDLGDLVIKTALSRTGERKATRYWLKI
jgi:Fic family protein